MVNLWTNIEDEEGGKFMNWKYTLDKQFILFEMMKFENDALKKELFDTIVKWKQDTRMVNLQE